MVVVEALSVGVLIEGLLISILEEFIVDLLIVSSESVSLPFFKRFSRFLILLVHVLRLPLKISLFLFFPCLLLPVYLVYLFLRQCEPLLVSFESGVRFLQNLELFLEHNE